LPIEGVSSEMIKAGMNMAAVNILSKEGTLHWVDATKPELLVIAGAGDIDQLVPQIKKILSES
jgi:UDP-N-acetylmuramate--alanine ligase